ncbi:MAG: hypothetical protein HC780_29175 [Leptolyngbyaceae cyanobacterium CSU_1_3]|nr:hypothetical protein [Leptolyngbyaceae cyanobacterium CSU_1_3]
MPTVFAEVSIDPQFIQPVAKAAKVKLSDRDLFTDGLGEAGSGGKTYQKMLIAQHSNDRRRIGRSIHIFCDKIRVIFKGFGPCFCVFFKLNHSKV